MPSKASLQQTVKLLKSARERQGLSQRALAAKIGVPQSHLSKIETGRVDIQTSSLIELARALDLELVLVPRRLLPAIAALQRQGEPDSSPEFDTRLHANLNRVLTQIEGLEVLPDKPKALTHLTSTLENLRPLRFGTQNGVEVQTLLDHISNTLKQIRRSTNPSLDKQIHKEALLTLDALTRELRLIRNRMAHPGAAAPTKAVPAYRLDPEDSDD
jgi:transcriptional regulator with XRE-family HTH domain